MNGIIKPLVHLRPQVVLMHAKILETLGLGATVDVAEVLLPKQSCAVGQRVLAVTNHHSIGVELHRRQASVRLCLPTLNVVEMRVPSWVALGEEEDVGQRIDVLAELRDTVCGIIMGPDSLNCNE